MFDFKRGQLYLIKNVTDFKPLRTYRNEDYYFFFVEYTNEKGLKGMNVFEVKYCSIEFVRLEWYFLQRLIELK